MLPYNYYDDVKNPATWVDIDAQVLRRNIEILAAEVDRPVLVAVKANGYGHGIEIAARAFQVGGAKMLGVARVAEALLLRKMGFEIPILIIGGITPDTIGDVVAAGIDFFVWDAEHLQALKQIGDAGRKAQVHIKVDTGMGRLGCLPDEVAALADDLLAMPNVKLAGLGTHFASADILDRVDTAEQIKKFDDVIAALAAKGIRPPLIHAANSPGGLYFKSSRYDMVRFGISAYGIAPDTGLSIPKGVAPALSWRARLVGVKTLPAGHGVSYGSEYRTQSPMRVGVMPVGYGDGYRRVRKVNSVLVAGQECAVLGRVCMDHCMIDLGNSDAKIGDEVVVLGVQGNRKITAEDLAVRWNTNPYDVFTGIAQRVARHEVGA